MRAQILMLVAGLAGCSKLLGIDDLSGPPLGDGGPGDDGRPPGDSAPPQITVSGTITRFLATNPTPVPLADYPVALVKMPGRVRIVNGMTDATGRYSMTADTGGAPLDAHLEIAGSVPFDLPPSVSHFAAPLTADVPVHNLQLNTNTGLRGGGQQAGDPIMTTTAVVRVFVANGDAMPVAGAAVTIETSTRVSYLGASGVDPSLTATSDRGIAFAFNATVGMVTVAGQLAGDPIAPSTIPIFAAGESHYLTLTP